MKMLIIGLGNVGALHGWALSQAGVDVIHAVRNGRTELINDVNRIGQSENILHKIFCGV